MSANILDIGSGSGYLTALLARLNSTAIVYGIDCNEEMIELAKANIGKHNNDLFTTKNVRFVLGNGLEGFSEGQPYTAINVGASVKTIPSILVDQLAVS